MIKKLTVIMLGMLMIFSLVACGNSSPAKTSTVDDANSGNSQVNDTTQNEETKGDGKMLVAYFSLAGEQYGVGVVEEGNTAIIAQMIAEQTGADLFEIKAKTPYPTTYQELLDFIRANW